jgi:hypothetical protein
LVIVSTYVTIVYLATDNMHELTMYILWLRSSWGTSRIRPSWSPSGHVLTPVLSPFQRVWVRSHACPEEVVYSLNDSCSYFTQRLFPPSVSDQPMYSEHLIIIHDNGTHPYYTSHSYVHSHPHFIHHIHTYIHIFISSALRGRLAALNSLCPIPLQLLNGYYAPLQIHSGHWRFCATDAGTLINGM